MKSVRSAMVAGFAAVALFVGPSLAQAAQGFIINQTDLKAGPDEQFPTVDQVQAGATVDVYGCLSGNTWCDISVQKDRGWVSGQDLEVMFQNKRVKIVEVTTEVVPVVTFQVASYWTQYYRDKPFFKDRDRFASINININNGGKAAAGKTGSGGQADVTGSINRKETTGSAAASGGAKTGKATGSAEANASGNGCPAGQKNCKAQGNAGGGNAMGKSAKGDMNMGKTGNGAATAGKSGGTPTASANNCKPGTPKCQQGAGGDMGGNGGTGASGGTGGSTGSVGTSGNK